jgi:hypothetical protein
LTAFELFHVAQTLVMTVAMVILWFLRASFKAGLVAGAPKAIDGRFERLEQQIAQLDEDRIEGEGRVEERFAQANAEMSKAMSRLTAFPEQMRVSFIPREVIEERWRVLDTALQRLEAEARFDRAAMTGHVDKIWAELRRIGTRGSRG